MADARIQEVLVKKLTRPMQMLDAATLLMVIEFLTEEYQRKLDKQMPKVEAFEPDKKE